MPWFTNSSGTPEREHPQCPHRSRPGACSPQRSPSSQSHSSPHQPTPTSSPSRSRSSTWRDAATATASACRSGARTPWPSRAHRPPRSSAPSTRAPSSAEQERRGRRRHRPARAGAHPVPRRGRDPLGPTGRAATGFPIAVAPGGVVDVVREPRRLPGRSVARSPPSTGRRRRPLLLGSRRLRPRGVLARLRHPADHPAAVASASHEPAADDPAADHPAATDDPAPPTGGSATAGAAAPRRAAASEPVSPPRCGPCRPAAPGRPRSTADGPTGGCSRSPAPRASCGCGTTSTSRATSPGMAEVPGQLAGSSRAGPGRRRPDLRPASDGRRRRAVRLGLVPGLRRHRRTSRPARRPQSPPRRGVVVTYGGRLASTFYSASGGGFAANVAEGFGTPYDVPYLPAHPYPTVHPDEWSVDIALADVAGRLDYPGTVTDVRVDEVGPSGRPLRMTIDGDAGPRGVDPQDVPTQARAAVDPVHRPHDRDRCGTAAAARHPRSWRGRRRP